MSRQIIQIAGSYGGCFALCDDRSLLFKGNDKNSWSEVEKIPETIDIQTSIDILGFKTRLRNILKMYEIYTLEAIESKSDKELLNMVGIGIKLLYEIRSAQITYRAAKR